MPCGSPLVPVSKMEAIQINLQHSRGATGILIRHLNTVQQTNKAMVALVQEPWVVKNSIRGLNLGGKVFYRQGQYTPRTCIVLSKEVDAMQLQQFCSRDLTTVLVETKMEGVTRKLILASAYLPFDSVDLPPSQEVVDLVDYHIRMGIPLVIGCDANAHHVLWGSSDINGRGRAMASFIVGTDMDLLNRGRSPTFVTKRRKEVLDITLVSQDFLRYVSGWHVSQEDSLSDHRHIRFLIDVDELPDVYRRNPRNTDWSAFKAELEEWLGEDKQLQDRIGKLEIEQEVEKLSSALLGSYEAATPQRRVRRGKKTPWWNSELGKLRKEARRSFRIAMQTMKEMDWREHRNLQRQYKRAI